MANEYISRAEAKAKGLSRYWTGLECKFGHIAERGTANGVCITCRYEIEKRYKAAHPEKIKEKVRKQAARHRIENPERIARNKKRWADANKDKIADKGRRWIKSNPERKKENDKRWRIAHPEHIAMKNKTYKTLHAARLSPIAIARTKQWCLDNPERAKALRAKVTRDRRARIKELGGEPYTVTEVNKLLELQSWKCTNCNGSLKKSRELDHNMPIALNGKNELANFQWLCMPCNRKKRDKDPIVWAQENGRLL